MLVLSAGRPMGALGTSEHLHLLLRMTSGRLDAASELLWSHPRLRDVFPEYLSRLYHVGRATLALMELTRERARLLAPECPVASLLVPYLDRHLVEERHHDEWLLDDLEVLGVSRDEVVDRVPPGEVASLIGSLHYWVHHHHPVALLAYLYVAEGHPFTREFLDQVAARTGLPKKGLRWFYRHAVLDVRHGADIAELLDGLPLREGHLVLLEASLMTVVDNMGVFMERVVSSAERLPVAAPAL